MPVSAPVETYGRMIHYGLKKTKATAVQLIMQSIAAGIWVGVYGHCCTALSGGFWSADNHIHKAVAKVIYGSVFPGAFAAIILTGCELFTGNTVTMMMCFMDDRISFFQLLRVWVISFVGNFVGANIGAGMSVLSGAFANEHLLNYLTYMVEKKISHTFVQALFLGIGCNLLVTLAVWTVVSSDDAAGKILNMWFPILAFAAGGYEHIIANFYTLTTAVFLNVDISYWKIVVFNWIPVFIGNLVAGAVVTGGLWWFAFHPPSTSLDLATEKELMAALSGRKTHTDLESIIRKNEEHSKETITNL